MLRPLTHPARRPRDLSSPELAGIDYLAAGARYQRVQCRLINALFQEPDRAIRKTDMEAVAKNASQLGQRFLRIVGDVLRLGPRHRLGGFGQPDRVRSPIEKIGNAQALLALESRSLADKGLIKGGIRFFCLDSYRFI